MRYLLAAILVFLFPAVVQAEPGAIRAGEHAKFSRLVIEIPVGADWQLSRFSEGYLLNVPGVEGFDTNEIFSRIPTSRISKVLAPASNSEMQIHMNCDCHASAFQWRSDKIVIDIVDGAAPEESPFEDTKTEAAMSPVLPIVVPSPIGENLLQFPQYAGTQDEPPAQNNAGLSELEKIVVEGLALGASQGLLTPSDDLRLGITDTGYTQKSIESHFDQNQPGLLAHTSFGIGNSMTSEETSAVNDVCLPNSYFALGEWASGEDFFKTISPMRADLTDEFYDVSHVAINQLAKAYVSFGFGREAIEVLNIDQEMTRERKALVAIANVVDEQIQSNDILKNQIVCDSDSAFWSLLAGTDSSNLNLNSNTVLKTFRSLPVALQSQLSPGLSRQFINNGDFEAAELALSIGEFVPNENIDVKLVRLDLHTHLGASEKAEEGALKLQESSSRMTPKELIEFLRYAVSEQQPVDPEIIALADILRFEFSDTEWSAPLATIQIEALLQSHSSKRALELLEEGEQIILPQDAIKLRSEAVLDATDNFSDPDFLDIAFSRKVELTTAETQNAVSRRLLEMNLPERVKMLLESPAVGKDMMERRYLRAQAANELMEPEVALQALAGITSDRAMDLRHQAEQLMGASDIVVANSIRNDWRMGNWGTLSQGSDELLKTVSLSVLEEPDLTTQTSEPLAQGRDLLEKSERARILMSEVLDRFETVNE